MNLERRTSKEDFIGCDKEDINMKSIDMMCAFVCVYCCMNDVFVTGSALQIFWSCTTLGPGEVYRIGYSSSGKSTKHRRRPEKGRNLPFVR